MPALSFASRLARLRRPVTVGLVAIVLGTTLPLAPSPAVVRVAEAAVATRYVGPGNGTDSDASCGTPTYATTAYASADLAIQAAVDQSSDGDTIRICAGTYDLSAGINLFGDPDVTLTLRGDDSANTILRRSPGADPASGFALLVAEVDLTVESLTLSGARGTYYLTGGAIRAAGSVTVRSSRFIDNSSMTGGAIHANAGALVEDSWFEGNRAGNYTYGSGGAVDGGNWWDRTANVVVRRSTFVENTAATSGGAVFVWGSLEVSGSTFTTNHGAQRGGALGAAGTLTVRDSSFVTNSSLSVAPDDFYFYSGGGDAIWADGTTGIERSTFQGNSPTSAVLVLKPVSVTDGTFVDNSGGDGAAIQTAFGLTNWVAIVGGRYEGNTSSGGGGAIRSNGNLAIRDAYFSSNQALQGDGGAAQAFGSVSITDSTFVRNVAWGGGGAVSSGLQSSALVDGSTFLDNSSYNGAALATGTGSVTIRRSTFAGNGAEGDGGAISAGGPTTVTSSTFVENTAGVDPGNGWAGGGGIAAYDALTIVGSTFVDNLAPIADGEFQTPVGGHVYVVPAGVGVAHGSIFVSNDAIGGCGFLSLTGSDNLTTDESCPGTLTTGDELALEPLAHNGGPTPTIALNRDSVARDAGGAGPCVAVTDQRGRTRGADGGCDFGAYEYSPVAYVGDGTTPSTTSECVAPDEELDHHAADQDAIMAAVRRVPEAGVVHLCAGTYRLSGAAILDTDQNVTLEGDSSTSTIVERSAGSEGFPFLQLGDPQVNFAFALDVEGLTFRNARGGEIGQGGAISGTASYIGPVTVRSSRFEDCWAREGGAIYLADASLTVTDGTSFADNSADTEGGAIRSGGATILSGATFTDNTAGNGGAVFVAPGQLTVIGGLFERNVARNDGGAIGGDPITLFGGTFLDNRAGQNGGAIIGTTVPIIGTTFRRNVAGASGGAVYTYTYVEVSAGTFLDNSAGTAQVAGYGGAIAATGEAYVYWSLLARNRSSVFGGALSVLTGGVSNLGINGSTFVENTAGSEGGAIYSGFGQANPSSTIGASTFIDNTALTTSHGAQVIRSGRTTQVGESLFVGGGCDSTMADAGGNVRAGSSCPGETSTRAGLRLGALGDHGGPTWTVPLARGSNAIDPTSGSASCSIGTDQRGEPRPAIARCDAGAYEYQPDDPADPYDHTTTVRLVATLGGNEITSGTAVTTGDRISVRAWVQSGTLPDVTQGVVVLRACDGSFSMPGDCAEGLGNIVGSASVTDGTTGGDGLGEATIPGWQPPSGTGYYRLGASFIVPGGEIAGSDISTGTPSFRVRQVVRIVWDTTAGASVVAAGTAIPVRARVIPVGGGSADGCVVGFSLDGGYVIATTGQTVNGVARATLPARAAGIRDVTATTGDGCVADVPAFGVLAVGTTTFPRGTIGSVGAGWYYLSGTSGTSASFGYRIEQTTGTVGKGKTAIKTTTTRFELTWISSNGWVVYVPLTTETTNGTSTTWQRPTCPVSASDGAGAVTTFAKGVLCGAIASRAYVSRWVGPPLWYTAATQMPFTASIIDGGTTRTGDATDWFSMVSVTDGGSPVAGLPVSSPRPLRFAQAGTTQFYGRLFIY